MNKSFSNSTKIKISLAWQRSVLMLLVITALLLLPSCAGNQTAESADTAANTATLTLSPTSIPTSTTTPTPTITPTPRLPVSLGTPMPISNLAISSGNLEKVVELGRWGNGVITDAAYSPDGKLIAVGSTLGVSIYQADPFKEILYFETDLKVNNIVFSPDGQNLATALDNKTVKMWSVKDGSLLNTFEYPKDEKASQKDIEEAAKKEVTSIAFSPDGKLLAAGAADGIVILWQVSDGSVLQFDKGSAGGDFYSKILAHISRVFFSPDGQSLFSASWNGKTRMISVSDGKQQQVFTGQWIADATLSSDGKILVMFEEYARSDPKLTLWNVEDGKKIQTIKAGDFYGIGITNIALSPDNQYIAAAWNDYSVKIWSVTSGALQNDFQDLVPKDFYYHSYFTAKFSPNGKTLLMAGYNILATWDVTNGSLTQNIKTKSEPMYKLDISPDGKSLAAVEGLNVDLWQISDGSAIPTNEQLQSNGTIDFSPDGNSMLTGMFKDSVLLMPLSEQGVRKSFGMEKKEYISGVAFSPDGKILALVASSPAGKVELRQVSDGLLLKTIGLNATYGFYGVEFSPNGEFLGISMDNQTMLFRVSDGKPIRSYNKGFCLAFSPDGTLLAAGASDKTLLVWKVPSGETVYNFKDISDSYVSSVRFSPDGKLLIAGISDGTIEVRNVSDGALLKTWKGHSREVTDLAFSPNGDLLFSSSYDGTVRVWGLKP